MGSAPVRRPMVDGRTPSVGSFRQDIQGLRALAVVLVLVYHVFPNMLPGGYVGVDVFFVISGFLISGLLIRERETTGTVNLLVFYERRIRRLLPAATLVLVFGAVGTWLFLPQIRWIDTAFQLLASAFYVENWYLYFQATDYLRADTLPGPFQHYWSLSIEEQFYVVWPLLILLIAGIFRFGTDERRKSVRTGLYCVTLLALMLWSLYQSVRITQIDQSAAYFLSQTRFWELALGGLAALMVPYVRLTTLVRAIVSWLCLAAIVASAWTYNDASAFPGWIALIPTCATALLLLVGGSRSSLSTDGLLSLTPVRYVGDISYSLYLWHWPIVIFGTAYVGTAFNGFQGCIAILLSTLLAAISKHLVEDRFRHRSPGTGAWRAYALFLVCSLLSVVAAAALYFPAKLAQMRAANAIIIETDYPGAAALVYNLEVPPPAEDPRFVPDLDLVRGDIPEVYALGCHVPRDRADINPCIFEYPPTDGTTSKTVMLIGDSHAAHWLPALREIGAKENWTVITHTKSSCPFVGIPLIVAQTEYPECQQWNEAVAEDVLARQPDLVVTSMITNHFAVGARGQEDNQDRLATGLVQTWQRLTDQGIQIAAIRGTPRMGQLVPNCIAENPLNPESCAIDRATAVNHGGAVPMAVDRSNGQVSLIDMTDVFCGDSTCQPIVGNVLVYRDESHITKTYMKTVAPVLEDRLSRLVD